MQNMRLLIFLTILNCCARPALPQSLSFLQDALKKDLTNLYNDLSTKHPGVYRYTSADTLRKIYLRVAGKITKPASAWEFFRIASELRTAVKCGHTRLRPSAAMQGELEKTGHFFPLPVQFAGNVLYARLPDQTIREVLTINGRPVAEVLRILFARFPTDGDAFAARYDMLTENFWLNYAWFIDFSTPQFELTLRIPNTGGKEVKRFASIPYGQAAAIRFYQGREDTALLHFEKKNGIAYVRIKTFSSREINGAGLSYRKFLEETFMTIEKEKIPNLILDIRGNGGGDDQYGALLCSYLADRPFSYFKRVYTLRDGIESPVNHPCVSLQQPVAHAFKGRVVLLVDGGTFSTAADVAGIFKSTQRGTLVGRETSGGYAGNTSGQSEQFTLANTKITVIIPQWYYENAVRPLQSDHRGVIPDIVIHKTPASIADNLDVDLQQAMQLLH